MTTTIDELLVGLGFEYDSDEMDEFKQDIDKTTSVIKKLAVAATVAATAITGMVVATTAASDEQGKFADEIGESVENIDALQFALVRSGGASESMSNSLRSLATRASEAARGIGAGVEVFGMLGLSTTDANGKLKSTTQLMLEISRMFQGLSQAQQIEFAEKLGIRDSLRLLQQGPDEINKLIATAKALGVTTAEDAALAAEFQDSLTDMWKVIKQVSRVITRDLAPVMDKTIGRFVDWWVINREIIEQKMPEFMRQLTIATKLFAIVTATWISYRLALHIAQLVKLFTAFNSRLLITNALVSFLPALIFGAIAAIALLAEDAKTFFEGGDSFLGDMIDKFPQWTEQIEIAAAVLASIADLGIMAFDGWKMLFNLFASGTFLDDMPIIIEQIKTDVAGLVDDITQLFFDMAADVFSALQEKIFDPLARPFNALKTKFFGSDENVFGANDTQSGIQNVLSPDNITNINNHLQQPETGLSQISNISNKTTSGTRNISVDNVNITVSGSGNPDQVAKAVNDMFQQTAQDLSTTVDQ